MGRKKIKIERITDERNRQVTFNKRKNGLLKKAMELSLLCDSSVALIIMNNSATAKERVFEYCSTDLDKHLVRYVEVTEPGVIKYTNNDYYKLFGKKGSAGTGSDGDSSDELAQPAPLHHHSPPSTSTTTHPHLHQDSSSTRDPLPSNGTIVSSHNATHPTFNNGYAVAIQHKDHYSMHGQSFEDFLKQSSYAPIFDGSTTLPYFDGPSSSSSVSHEHPSSQHHGTLFCPPIQLSKDLLTPHSHVHNHPPHFPFALGVGPINSAPVMAPMHAYNPQDVSYSNGAHRERDMIIFSHSHPHNHQPQNNQLSSSSSQQPPSLPPQHNRVSKEPMSPLSLALGYESSVESHDNNNNNNHNINNISKKRKVEKSI